MIPGKAWCLFLLISFLESHVTGGHQNGDLLEQPLSKVQIPQDSTRSEAGFVCHCKNCIFVAQIAIIHPLNSQRLLHSSLAIPWSPHPSSLGYPDLGELAMSQGRWREQSCGRAHFFIRKKLKGPCSSGLPLAFVPVTAGAGSSQQISLPWDEYQITGEYRTALDHLLKSPVKWIGTHIQELLQVTSVCLKAVSALPAAGSCQWCAGTPWHSLQRRQLGSRSVTRPPNLPIKM